MPGRLTNTMMHALNDLASQITTGTMKTEIAIEHFHNFCATYPNATIMYRANDMIIRCDADAAYLVAPKARSRASGYICMGNRDNNIQTINAPIMIIATIPKMVRRRSRDSSIISLCTGTGAPPTGLY